MTSPRIQTSGLLWSSMRTVGIQTTITSRSAILKFIRNKLVELHMSLVRHTTNGTNTLPTMPRVMTRAQTIVAVVRNSEGNTGAIELIALELSACSQSSERLGYTRATKFSELLSDWEDNHEGSPHRKAIGDGLDDALVVIAVPFVPTVKCILFANSQNQINSAVGSAQTQTLPHILPHTLPHRLCHTDSALHALLRFWRTRITAKLEANHR